MLKDYLPILLQVIVSVGFVAARCLPASSSAKPAGAIPPRTPPTSAGCFPIGGSQARFSVKFYLVAMLFILFDIEIVFMYPWAVVYREFVSPGTGPFLQRTGIFWSMLSFVFVLTVGYVYAIMKGALDWKR